MRYNTNEKGQIVLKRLSEPDKYINRMVLKTVYILKEYANKKFSLYTLPETILTLLSEPTKGDLKMYDFPEEQIELAMRSVKTPDVLGFHINSGIFILAYRVLDRVEMILRVCEEHELLQRYDSDYIKMMIHELSSVFFHELYHIKYYKDFTTSEYCKYAAMLKYSRCIDESEDYAIQNSDKFVDKHIDEIIELVLQEA